MADLFETSPLSTVHEVTTTTITFHRAIMLSVRSQSQSHLHGHIIIHATHTTRQIAKRIDSTRYIVGSRE